MEKKTKKKLIIAGIAAVAAVGATVFVVKKGPELKEELLEKVDALKAKIKDIEASEVKEAIKTKLNDIKEDIKAFDWEKSKEDVQNKFLEVKGKLKSVKKHIPLTEEEVAEQE
jgi:chaperonin cofactor prefoldin